MNRCSTFVYARDGGIGRSPTEQALIDYLDAQQLDNDGKRPGEDRCPPEDGMLETKPMPSAEVCDRLTIERLRARVTELEGIEEMLVAAFAEARDRAASDA
jgi:hypothetical protein